MISKLGWKGKFVFKIRNIETGEVKIEEVENRIMDARLDDLINTLDGVAPDITIKYLAIGTGNTAITDSDTVLDTEYFRTAPSIAPANSGTGEVTTEFRILDNEGNCQIEEVGIFVGAAATGSADSGKLLSRILWSHEKTSSEELTLLRIDSIGRV